MDNLTAAKDLLNRLTEAEGIQEFEIPIKIAFDGTVKVKAEDEEDAKNKAEEFVNAILGNVETHDECIVNTDIDMHGYCYTNLKEED